jgi:hypothetical protein
MFNKILAALLLAAAITTASEVVPEFILDGDSACTEGVDC